MKSDDELQAEMEPVQQKMVEAWKNERTNAPTHSKKPNVCVMSLALLLECLKVFLPKDEIKSEY